MKESKKQEAISSVLSAFKKISEQSVELLETAQENVSELQNMLINESIDNKKYDEDFSWVEGNGLHEVSINEFNFDIEFTVEEVVNVGGSDEYGNKEHYVTFNIIAESVVSCWDSEGDDVLLSKETLERVLELFTTK